jgi:Uncharacterized conserved protein (some members contain a von Willebrand factor type A (vWA) domain)
MLTMLKEKLQAWLNRWDDGGQGLAMATPTSPAEILKRVRRLEMKLRRLVSEMFLGAYESIFKGQGLEFEEVREYQPGDDVRTIDWNVTARMGKPFVKKVSPRTGVAGFPRRGHQPFLALWHARETEKANWQRKWRRR